MALQGGTSHYFGDGFAKAFDITYTDRENKLQHPHQTSWGVSTRMIGAVIMVHGDDNGLVLPPKIAPIQVVIVPVAMHKPGVLGKGPGAAGAALREVPGETATPATTPPAGSTPKYEMQGVPLRLEIGPKDMEQNQCVLVRRDNREKQFVSLDNLEEAIESSLTALHDAIYQRALDNLKEKTFTATTYEEFLDTAQNHPGFIKAMWCGRQRLRGQDQGGDRRREVPLHPL